LFELGRTLRRMDQEFQFDQLRNPIRIQQLEADLEATREQNRFDVLNNPIRLAQGQANVDQTEVRTEGFELDNQFDSETLPFRVDAQESAASVAADNARFSAATTNNRIARDTNDTLISDQNVIQNQQTTVQRQIQVDQQLQTAELTLRNVVLQLEDAKRQVEQKFIDSGLAPPDLSDIDANIESARNLSQSLLGSRGPASVRASGTTSFPATSSEPLGDARAVQQQMRLPVQGRISSGFGGSRGHNGIDIAVPVGTPVPAAMGGRVASVFNNPRGGKSVVVVYDDGTRAGFAHLSRQPLPQGTRFSAGDVIAVTGNTGRSTGPHLHYTLARPNSQGQFIKIDPRTYVPGFSEASNPASSARVNQARPSFGGGNVRAVRSGVAPAPPPRRRPVVERRTGLETFNELLGGRSTLLQRGR
jgi:murein DD-endopeptidase MepM/ murein hydrolase activator NlpD